MPFLDSLDIANRALDHLGASHIQNVAEDSVNNEKISFVYDKVRRAELRRNTWRFAIRKAVLRPVDTTTFGLVPDQWNAGVQYLPGSVVTDGNGQIWVSNKANNIGNDPATSNFWDSYFGSMVADAWDSTLTYYAGDVVYISKADGSFVVYLSRQNNNQEEPDTADAWSATTSYSQDQTVSYSGEQWRSLIAFNLNHVPTGGPANWNAATTYAATNQVTGSDGFIYTSVGSSNTGHNPVTDDGTYWTNTDTPNAWVAVPTLPASSGAWTPLYAALESINLMYPLGAGPSSQSVTKNIFRLPAGFLRRAPQDPKAGINSFLGAPAWNSLDDWELEGDYLISSQSEPILLRFVADIQQVTKMDDMFCEGFAARIGLEACEAITNSNAKQQTCNNAYMKFMSEARIVNAIENGPTEPPEDDYITCRM